MARTDPRPTNNSPIARLRIERGITQAQLAERIGCPYTSVSRWERSGKPPGTKYLIKIAEVFGCRLDELL